MRWVYLDLCVCHAYAYVYQCASFSFILLSYVIIYHMSCTISINVSVLITYTVLNSCICYFSLEPSYQSICYSRRPMKGPSTLKNSLFLVIFDDFGALWSPGGTPYPSPDTLWMIILSLGHSIMCVSKRNLIQCMGDMALMAIMCEKWPIFMWFLMIFWTFGGQMGPHILHQTPYEWLFYLWDTQSCVYQREIWFNVWVIWL